MHQEIPLSDNTFPFFYILPYQPPIRSHTDLSKCRRVIK